MRTGTWNRFVRPILFRLDAEQAHHLGISALKMDLGFGPKANDASDPILKTEQFGLKFPNPIGVAAGFDKNGEVINALSDLGFGSVEVGTVTFDPQPGNPKPRLFRLPDDRALINRLGFNNDGAEVIARRLAAISRKGVVGVNIGKNKDVPLEEAAENYAACFDVMHRVADYIVVNVSSPNTPNLRELQHSEGLDGLLTTLQARNRELGPKPLLVKISPDLTEIEVESIVGQCVQHEVAGIIATNTTISRDGLITSGVVQFGAGGLSGRPVFERSNRIISLVYKHSKVKLPVIGVGGVMTAEDAFKKITAGASLVQVYTGFVYGGINFASEMNRGLAWILRDRGFSNVESAVGSEV